MQKKVKAAIGSFVFFCLAPGVVAGVLPWSLTDWKMLDPFPLYVLVRIVGVIVLVVAVGFLVHSFVRFVAEGLGTPAPVAPTVHLVVGGAYRFVRNPMYVAVVAAVFGQALLLGQGVLFWYGLAIALLQAAFVRFYEEPELRERYGAEYDAYRRAVPAWFPRLRPWRGSEMPST